MKLYVWNLVDIRFDNLDVLFLMVLVKKEYLFLEIKIEEESYMSFKWGCDMVNIYGIDFLYVDKVFKSLIWDGYKLIIV